MSDKKNQSVTVALERGAGGWNEGAGYNFSFRAWESQKVKRNLPHALSLPSLAHLIGFPLPPTRLSLAPGKCLMVGCSPPGPDLRGRLGLGAALPFTTFPRAPVTAPSSGGDRSATPGA